jgi:hypothetical protein
MKTRLIAPIVLLGLAASAGAQVTPTLPDLGSTEITLSWQDFKRLVEAGRPLPAPTPALPRDAVLRSAEYSGRVEPGVLVLDAVVRVDVLKRGWTRLPLWSEGSLVRFDGDGAMLHRGAEGLELMAQGPRAYELRARLVYAAPDHPGENRVQLALPDAPLNLLDLTAADGLQDLEVTTGVAYRVLPSRVFATLHGGRATIRYRVPYRAADAEGGEIVTLEPRVLLTSYQFLNLGDGVVSGLLVNDYQVRVAKVSEFEIGLAEGIEVFDVEAEGLEGWQVLQRDGSRVLRARLAAPTEGGVRVIVTFDGGYDREVGDVGVPRFEPLDVERESGFVAVAAEGAEVELNLSGNLLPADLLEIPGDVRAFGGSVTAVLKYAGVPDAATAVVTEHEDAEVLTAIVERLNASTVVVGSGTEATWLDLTVKNNRKQFLKLRLDEEIEVWSLLVDGEPARPKRSEGQVFVPLPRGDGERTAVISLVLLRRGEPMPGLGTTRPSLPGLDVPVSEAMWTLYLPPGPRYRPIAGEFRVLNVTAPLSGFGGLGLDQRLPMPVVPMGSDDAYMSKEIVEEQNAQQQRITQQLKARQGAGRRGSLPVRIRLPGGVASLPQITVARILIVDDDATLLPVRVYPGWFDTALRMVKMLLIAAAGVLLALLAIGRIERRFGRWVGVAVLIALLPLGGVSVLASVFTVIAVALLTWLSFKAVNWLAARANVIQEE